MVEEANEQAAQMQAFVDSWPDTRKMLLTMAKDLSEAQDFGDKMKMGIDALDAGLAILSALGLIDSALITLSGWKYFGKVATLKYTTSLKQDDNGGYKNTIQKDMILNEEL